MEKVAAAPSTSSPRRAISWSGIVARRGVLVGPGERKRSLEEEDSEGGELSTTYHELRRGNQATDLDDKATLIEERTEELRVARAVFQETPAEDKQDAWETEFDARIQVGRRSDLSGGRSSTQGSR